MRQFSLLGLMGVTALLGLLLGVGRIVAPSVADLQFGDGYLLGWAVLFGAMTVAIGVGAVHKYA